VSTALRLAARAIAYVAILAFWAIIGGAIGIVFGAVISGNIGGDTGTMVAFAIMITYLVRVVIVDNRKHKRGDYDNNVANHTAQNGE